MINTLVVGDQVRCDAHHKNDDSRSSTCDPYEMLAGSSGEGYLDYRKLKN